LCQATVDVFADCTTTDSYRGKLCAGSAKLVPQKTHSLVVPDWSWGKSDAPWLGLREGEPWQELLWTAVELMTTGV